MTVSGLMMWEAEFLHSITCSEGFCYAKISMREHKGTRAKHSLPSQHPGHSPRKLILTGRPQPCSKCFMLWILRRLFHWFGHNSHHLIPSKNILICMPWVMCYQYLRSIGSIKFIITICHHGSPDLSTVKNVFVKQLLLETEQIFLQHFSPITEKQKIFLTVFSGFPVHCHWPSYWLSFHKNYSATCSPVMASLIWLQFCK